MKFILGGSESCLTRLYAVVRRNFQNLKALLPAVCCVVMDDVSRCAAGLAKVLTESSIYFSVYFLFSKQLAREAEEGEEAPPPPKQAVQKVRTSKLTLLL